MDARFVSGCAARVLAFGLACFACPSSGSAFDAPSGIIIHDAGETLREHCERDGAGILWLVLPSGGRFELIETTADPSIANPGDGAFHPFDESHLSAALAQVRYPLQPIQADVFLLPFPRRSGLESAAAPGLILLAPGVRPLSTEQQHAEFVHELGHVVQYALMPDDDSRWSQYRRIRAIDDEDLYAASGAHANRPHEIFAEDFRALFGGSSANYSGTIENTSLVHPSAVPGLAGFLMQLAETRLERIVLRASANPARSIVRFESGRPLAVALDIVDVTGRRIATVQPVRTTAGVEWTWDRRDAGGVRVGPGVVYARARDDRNAVTRVVLAP